MNDKEKELVTSEFKDRKDTYNLKTGGEGGFDYLNEEGYENPTHKKSHLDKMTKSSMKKFSENKEYREGVIERLQLSVMKAHKEGKIRYNTFQGKKHSEETKRKMR
jgi:hypothetical protein